MMRWEDIGIMFCRLVGVLLRVRKKLTLAVYGDDAQIQTSDLRIQLWLLESSGVILNLRAVISSGMGALPMMIEQPLFMFR